MANAANTWIVGNWKMHGANIAATQLVQAVAAYASAHHKDKVEIVICPPATLLHSLYSKLKDSAVVLGGQDCHPQATGAYTGDISANMLKDAGCEYVIVGHSERRAGHGETDALVKQKAEAALKAGLTPIICVGETLAQREQGDAKETVKQQVAHSVPAGACIIAYEPVWAIGTGKTATADDIEAMHTYIIGLLGGRCPVIYGGSVKPSNAREILNTKGVSGVLVGGASLVAEEFCEIIEAVK